MADTKKAKDAADVTEVPSGLDVAVTVPGTHVGGHDLQGADGEERTDRPGEILGTPALTEGDERRIGRGRVLESAKTDYVTAEVDRANREELPKLGGHLDDGWRPGNEKTEAGKAAAEALKDFPATVAATAPRATEAKTTTTDAKASDSGISVGPKTKE